MTDSQIANRMVLPMLIIGFLVFGGISIYGQNKKWKQGYVINMEKDTLHGLIKMRPDWGFYVEHRKDENSNAKQYTANDLIGYLWGKECYKRVFIRNRSPFLIFGKFGDYFFGKKVVDGCFKYYELQLNHKQRFFETHMLEVNNEFYEIRFNFKIINKGKISKLFNKYEMYSTRLLNEDFDNEKFTELLENYNFLVESDCK